MIDKRLMAFGLLVLGLSGSADAQIWPRHFDFSLLKGGGTPVCDAYVERLNQSEFTNYPFCDRPEDDRIEGFERLQRVALSIEEAERLYDQAYSFSLFGDAGALEGRRAARRQRGLSVGNPAPEYERDARQNISLAQQGRTPFFYRFDPKIDIDNDGTPDDVVVWKNTGVPCGKGSGPADTPSNSPTFLIVLDAAGKVDAAKTQALFGHPRGNTYVDDKGVEFSPRNPRYRPIGLNMGVVVFDGVSYFDTFYGNSDLSNQRFDDPNIRKILALLEHAPGGTNLVCEVLYRGPYQRAGSEK